jgi:hypothetical protein
MFGVRKALLRKDLRTRVVLAFHRSPPRPALYEKHAALEIRVLKARKTIDQPARLQAKKSIALQRVVATVVKICLLRLKQLNNRKIEVRS